MILEGAQNEEAFQIRGSVGLEGSEDAQDIVVRARVAGSLVGTTLTDEVGSFILTVPPIDLTLTFSKEGYESLDIDLVYQEQGEYTGQFTLDDTLLEEVDDLTLTRLTGQLSVSVTLSPAWIPIGQREATVRVIGQGEERSAIALNGPVVFTDLPAGDYLVFANRSGFSEGLVAVTLDDQDPNAEVTLTISLKSLRDARLDLGGVILTGDNLRTIDDLRGASLSGANLASANLCGLDLSGASLVASDLTNADLSGVKLVGARLDNTTLTGASLW